MVHRRCTSSVVLHAKFKINYLNSELEIEAEIQRKKSNQTILITMKVTSHMKSRLPIYRSS